MSGMRGLFGLSDGIYLEGPAMNFQRIGWLGLAVALVVWYAMPAVAEGGVPSQATLHAMGLADAQIVSDDQALTVRGLGFGGKGGKGGKCAKGHNDGTAL